MSFVGRLLNHDCANVDARGRPRRGQGQTVAHLEPAPSSDPPVIACGDSEHHSSHRWNMDPLTERSHHVGAQAPASGLVYELAVVVGNLLGLH
jgi:hypothetical protein